MVRETTTARAWNGGRGPWAPFYAMLAQHHAERRREASPNLIRDAEQQARAAAAAA